MAANCSIPECTIAETGACLQGNPPETCRNRIDQSADISLVQSVASDPPLLAPEKSPRFPSSLAMDIPDVTNFFSSTGGRLVGILGPPESGKTAVIVSLFLLLCRDKLSNFQFADSKTLMALNEIAQGARRWNSGAPPERMLVHTELKDEREAAFLHLRVRRTDEQRIDFLFPDLPGEWTNTFIDSNRSDRLDFLKAADCIWIVANGRALSKLETRRTTLRRIDLLLARLKTMLLRPVPLLLVLSHRDAVETSDADLVVIREAARTNGFTIDVVQVASFSQPNGTVDAGFGIAELIEKTIGAIPSSPAFWPTSQQQNFSRSMFSFVYRSLER